LGKLPLDFNLYQSSLKPFIIGISQRGGKINIRFIGLDDQDLALSDAKAIPGLIRSHSIGQPGHT
jgi:hypothetical protein